MNIKKKCTYFHEILTIPSYIVKNNQPLGLLKHLCSLMVLYIPFSFAASDNIANPVAEFKISLVTYSFKNPQSREILTKKKNHDVDKIFKILSTHYKQKPSDPDYIQSDLEEMAKYYSQFPHVVTLLTKLQSKDWTLNYNQNTWSTIAKGNALNVDSATIQFNSRSAAMLKFNNGCKHNFVCIASPADALLHELLHALSMLVNTEEFIQQGGMNHFRYPYKHEYSVIQAENALYASMSRIDGIKRPQRNEHMGRKIIASCVTCIK